MSPNNPYLHYSVIELSCVQIIQIVHVVLSDYNSALSELRLDRLSPPVQTTSNDKLFLATSITHGRCVKVCSLSFKFDVVWNTVCFQGRVEFML